MIIKNISGEIQVGIDTGFPQIGILDVGINAEIQVTDELGHYYTQSLQSLFVPIVNISSTGGQVDSIVEGTNITVDSTDPANPIVSAILGGNPLLIHGTITDIAGIATATVAQKHMYQFNGTADIDFNTLGTVANITHGDIVQVSNITDYAMTFIQNSNTYSFEKGDIITLQRNKPNTTRYIT